MVGLGCASQGTTIDAMAWVLTIVTRSVQASLRPTFYCIGRTRTLSIYRTRAGTVTVSIIRSLRFSPKPLRQNDLTHRCPYYPLQHLQVLCNYKTQQLRRRHYRISKLRQGQFGCYKMQQSQQARNHRLLLHAGASGCLCGVSVYISPLIA